MDSPASWWLGKLLGAIEAWRAGGYDPDASATLCNIADAATRYLETPKGVIVNVSDFEVPATPQTVKWSRPFPDDPQITC